MQECVSNFHELFQFGAQQLAGCKQKTLETPRHLRKYDRRAESESVRLEKKKKTSHEIFYCWS